MPTRKKKVILIGYRACGKSSIGRLLAKRLGWNFLDLDQVIETRESCSIKELVEKYGWDYFRRQEKNLLREIIDLENIVVATGGGAVLHHDLWPRILQSFFSVWLVADHDTICQRLAGDSRTEGQRPSLTGRNVLDEAQKIMAEREPFYKKYSHLAVNTALLSPAEVARAVERALDP